MMLQSIGRKKRRTDLVGLLLECHERIRTFCALVVEVGRADAEEEETRAACDRFVRYFSEALPLHVIDEEESLLPRLVRAAPELRPAFERMLVQHDAHGPLIDRVLELGKAVGQAPSDRALRRELFDLGKRLSEELKEHLLLEERMLFPKIPEVLSQAEQDAILQEMRARRQSVQEMRAPGSDEAVRQERFLSPEHGESRQGGAMK